MLTQRQLQQVKNDEPAPHVQGRWIHKALEVYPEQAHHEPWRYKGVSYLYRSEYNLTRWFEIEGDTLRSCLMDSSDGGVWGVNDKGQFCVSCFYHETTDRPDLIEKVKQLHWKQLHSHQPGGKGRNPYLDAKGY